jgi:DNA-binding MarR family transcriptional regulator
MILIRYCFRMTTKSMPGGAAFLLAQLGAHAASRFGERIAAHDLTPPMAGILGLLSASPGTSQQELANRLGMLPSRLVAFVDDLEERGLVQRVRDDVDRRRNSLQLTDDGRAALATIAKIGREHEGSMTAALSDREREQLVKLLGRIADEQGLTRGVHPGYRSVRPPRAHS